MNYEYKYKSTEQLLRREQAKLRVIMDWICEELNLDFRGEVIMSLRQHLKDNGYDDLLW